jgi:hypothetical protein
MQVIEMKRLQYCSHNVQGKILFQVASHIELHDISFSYPSQPNVKIFDRFNISIPAGTTVACFEDVGVHNNCRVLCSIILCIGKILLDIHIIGFIDCLKLTSFIVRR